jgi:ComF family protein
MRAIRALFIYLAAVFIGGGLLAPWLYWAGDALGLMDNVPFHRVVHRCLLLIALTGIWPLLRFSGLGSWRSLGLAPVPQWRGLLVRGFLLGVASLAIVGGCAVMAGARAWHIDPAAPHLVLVLLGAAMTALIVAVLEEALFRGAIFGTLRQGNHWLAALFLSSAIYSLVHFFQRAPMRPSLITWASGLQLLPQMVRGFADPQQIVPGFFVLLLAGAILAAGCYRTGSLHFSIGLHAGWIFWAQSYAVLTKQQASPLHPFWGSAKIIDGWFGLIVLAPLLAWFLRRPPENGGRHAPGTPRGAHHEPLNPNRIMTRTLSHPWVATTKRYWEAAMGFLYAEVCQACQQRRATASDGYVCAHCRATVRFISPPFCKRCGAVFEGAITMPFECGNCRGVELHFSSARASVPARDVVLEMIHAYKYNQALWIEPFLTELLIQIAAPVIQAEGWDLIVPIPLHPRRQAQREFNQAERLAAALSTASRVPWAAPVLARILDTRTQTRLSRQERAKNMQRAFALRAKPAAIAGRRIVLVDDVLTTGATANAAARVLRRQGAAEVCVWTLARGLLH